MKIRDLPQDSRPIEKAARLGFASLSNAELLAIFINTGYPNVSAIDIANYLITKHRTLHNIAKLNKEHLIIEKGISEVKAFRLLALFEFVKRINQEEYKNDAREWNPHNFYQAYRLDYFELKHEKICIYYLNDNFQVIHQYVLYEGNESGFDMSLSRIFYYAILHNAKKLVISHNHPSQNIEPSLNDMQFTLKLEKECTTLNIILVDHIIFTNSGYYSFYENNALCKNTAPITNKKGMK